MAAVPPSGSLVNVEKIIQQHNKPVAAVAVPAFVTMPESTAKLTDRISNSPSLLEDSVNEVAPKDDFSQIKAKVNVDKTF